MATLFEVDHLYKRYGAVVVADDICCAVDRASCVGLIGPNGAGKSSLFNMLTGIIAPDDGVIRFEGRDIGGIAAHRRARLGIVRAFQIPRPFAQLSVYENVLTAALYGAGLSGASAQRHAADVLNKTGLLAHADEPAGHLRLLDRKRLELAKAIASRAKLLLLDEIASGLTEHEVAALDRLDRGVESRSRHHLDRAHSARAARGRRPDHGAAFRPQGAGRRAAGVMASPMVREIYMGLPADAA